MQTNKPIFFAAVQLILITILLWGYRKRKYLIQSRNTSESVVGVKELHNQNRTTCSGLLKITLNNVSLHANIVQCFNNIVQHCSDTNKIPMIGKSGVDEEEQPVKLQKKHFVNSATPTTFRENAKMRGLIAMYSCSKTIKTVYFKIWMIFI